MKTHTIAMSVYCLVLIWMVALGCNSGSVISDSKTDGQLSKQQRDSAKAVLKELNKLGSYTEAGINYPEYQRRVLDAKGEIDSHLLDIPSGPVKDALITSLDAYVVAREFWGLAIQRERGSGIFYLEKDEIERYAKYEVVVETKGDRGLTGSKMVQVFWLRGAGHAKIAETWISD